jgi:hypothetical protein
MGQRSLSAPSPRSDSELAVIEAGYRPFAVGFADFNKTEMQLLAIVH